VAEKCGLFSFQEINDSQRWPIKRREEMNEFMREVLPFLSIENIFRFQKGIAT